MSADLAFTIAHTLADLPLLPNGITVRQFSSHNRAGLNMDCDAFLYTDSRGDSVIFDAAGPGCVRSMWSTCIPDNQVLLFYFDGEAEPRYEIPTLQFFKGEHPSFPRPLNSYERVGYYGDLPFAGNSFVPIPFARSLKIAVHGDRCFHHILYEQYPHGTPVATFTGHEDRSALLLAFEARGQAFSLTGLEQEVISCAEMAPDAELVLLDRKHGGTVRRIVIEADGSDAFINGVMLQMCWDGARLPQVHCPIGHFFATPLRADSVDALPVQVQRREDGRVTLTSWFPMPYWEAAQIRLVNRSGQRLGPVKAEIGVDRAVYPRDRSGYLVTQYREGQTDFGRDWLFFTGPGVGRFIGVVQTMLGEHYCEGDEHFSLDHACSPQINGTGSEDYYLACFWPNRHHTRPFSGCVGDAFQEGGGWFEGAYRCPGRYYRFHLEAPIPFYSHADLRIQHGAESNIRSHYSSLAFLYLSPTPVHRRTDFIKVGNAQSEAMHRYLTSGPGEVTTLDARCEGDQLHFRQRDCGRIHVGGEITFVLALDPENEGVRIRRRLDQAVGRQWADVYVDGEFAGTWYHADQNPHLRWFDSDLDIHPRLTRGKERIDVRLVLGGEGSEGFTDFAYEAFCVRYAGEPQ